MNVNGADLLNPLRFGLEELYKFDGNQANINLMMSSHADETYI